MQLGVDEGTWGAWEAGKAIIFRKHRVLIERLFGLSLDQINF